MFWECRKHGENLNKINKGMTNRAVDERMKSKRLKTELITNAMSHMRKTLTSIINYDLLSKEELHKRVATAARSYWTTDVLKLKKLIEDLVRKPPRHLLAIWQLTASSLRSGVFMTQTVGEF